MKHFLKQKKQSIKRYSSATRITKQSQIKIPDASKKFKNSQFIFSPHLYQPKFIYNYHNPSHRYSQASNNYVKDTAILLITNNKNHHKDSNRKKNFCSQINFDQKHLFSNNNHKQNTIPLSSLFQQAIITKNYPFRQNQFIKMSNFQVKNQPNKEINYDSFLFVDNITNKKILLKDITNQYQNKNLQNKFKNKSQIILNQDSENMQQYTLNNHHKTESKMESCGNFKLSEEKGLKLNNQKQYLINTHNIHNFHVKSKTMQTQRKNASDRQRRTGKIGQKAYSSQNEMKQINACLKLMKNTKLFQLDSLRQKIFKNIGNTNQQSNFSDKKRMNAMQILIKQKKQLKELIDNAITHFQRKQLQQFLYNSKKLINPKIMNLRRLIPRNINKHNIEKVIHEILTNIQTKKPQQDKIKKMSDISDILLEGQQKFKSQMIDYLHKVLKQRGQYLIVPENQYQIRKMLLKMMPKNINQQSQIQFNNYFKNNQCQKQTKREEQNVQIQTEKNRLFSEIDSLKFRQNLKINKIEELKQIFNKPKKVVKIIQSEIFSIVKAGFFFDLQTQLVSHPHLINAKDRKGNTLLHVSAKYNNLQIFEYLVKKIGADGLKIKNDFGKTTLDVARIFDSKQVIEKCKQYMKVLAIFSMTSNNINNQKGQISHQNEQNKMQQIVENRQY